MMIDSLARKLAVTIKEADPEQTSSVEIMQYSLIIYINTTLIIVESLLIGWLSGKFLDTIISLFAIMLLRFFSGGIHIASTWGCNVLSVVICTSIPHVPQNESLTIVFTILSLALIILFAPSIDDQTRIDTKHQPLMKIISIVIVCANFIFHSYVLGLSFLIQSLTIIPLRRR